MKKLLVCLFVASIGFCPVASLDAAEVDWNEVTARYTAYIENPNDETARRLLAVLPEEAALEGAPESEWREGNAFIFAKERFLILERLVRAGNTDSIKIAFRLQAISDGHNSELIYRALGALIVEKPRLFLLCLKENLQYVMRLDALLGNLGPQYVDAPERQLAELRRRREAISSVEDESVALIQKKVLHELNRQIKHREAIIREQQSSRDSLSNLKS
jgi:hypothetical protein